MKILLAVDGSSCSEAAARSVAQRPWPPGSRVLILSAYEGVIMMPIPEAGTLPPDFWKPITAQARERAAAAVSQAEKIVRGASPTLSIDTRVVEGYPKQAILDEAEQWSADLIVLGSHGHRGLTRLWLGSVSQSVAVHANCSVEIVRERAPQR